MDTEAKETEGQKDELLEMLNALGVASGTEAQQQTDNDSGAKSVEDSNEEEQTDSEEEVSDAKAEGTGAEKTEEAQKTSDPVRELKSDIEDLKNILSKRDEKPAQQEPPPEPKLEKFINDEEAEDIYADPSKLNAVLNRLFTKAVEVARAEISKLQETTIRELPSKVISTIETQNALKQLAEDFYKQNPDLKPFNKVVSVVFDEMAPQYKDAPLAEVLRKVGDETRSRLNLPKTPKPAKQENQPPPLPRHKGGKIPLQTPRETDPIKAEIEEMNKALGI